MARKKKANAGPPSIPRTTSLGPEELEYLQRMVCELQATLEKCRGAMEEKTDKICRNVDQWFNQIISTVPDEILQRPLREVWDTAAEILCVSPATPSVPKSLDSEPTTSKRLMKSIHGAKGKAKNAARQRGSFTTENRASHKTLAGAKPGKKAAKVKLRAPALHIRTSTGLPRITPKFDIRKPPATARSARKGETLVSLSGSPVREKSFTAPIHVHINKGRVVTVTSRDPTMTSLCKAVKKFWDKL